MKLKLERTGLLKMPGEGAYRDTLGAAIALATRLTHEATHVSAVTADGESDPAAAHDR